MNEKAFAQFRAHTIAEHPKEACGLLVADGRHQHYVRALNIADDPVRDFRIAPASYVEAAALGKIIAVCHSHPEAPADPSPADRTQCEASGLLWYILSWPEDRLVTFMPEGYVAPLLGRPFVHGVHDCYGIVRDYYQQKLNIELPDFEREADWWLDREGKPHQNLYLDNFEKAGFTAVMRVPPFRDLLEHDVILMQFAPAVVPSHAAIYVGNSTILHHPQGQLSHRTIYGGMWQRATSHVLRHRDLM
jgi:proteasome lid subunit RPN8/RPN11